MKKTGIVFLLLIFWNTLLFAKAKQSAQVDSPNGKISVTFELINGIPFYSVKKNNAILLENSRLGFELKDLAPLTKDFKIAETKKTSFDETWTQPWGEVKTIRNNYNQLFVALQEQTGAKRKLNLIFRIYNDGIGFRYEVPAQPSFKTFSITEELTEFNLVHDYNAWFAPAFGGLQDSEYLFKKNKLSQLNSSALTPLTMELADSSFISIHEAALVDYASMSLKPYGNGKLKADLVPWADGIKVKASAPMVTPWRTIQIASKAGDLITSYLILNLNEPSKLSDISWVKPGKYNGIWWGMHIKTQTWESGPKHGATTQNVKQLIDFASGNNITGVLAEGWNLGWDGDWTKNTFNFYTSYPDYNIEELSKYAMSKGVGLIAHHETACNVENYEKQMDTAFQLLEKNNIHGLKTGYVGLKNQWKRVAPRAVHGASLS